MSISKYYSAFAKNILDLAGNRKIVSWGYDKKINEIMSQYGINIEQIYTGNQKSIIDQGFIHYSFLKGMQQNLFVILPLKVLLRESTAFLKKNNYRDMKDYITLYPECKEVKGPIDHYEDNFGNCLENIPEDWKVVIEGYANTLKVENFSGAKTVSKNSIILKGANSSLILGKNVKLSNKPIVVGNNITITIAENVRISNPIELHDDCSLYVGKDTSVLCNLSIGSFSQLEIGENNIINTGKIRTGRNQKIIIGKDCLFSWDVVLISHDGHMIWDIQTEKSLNNTNIIRESVVIEDHVWIGGEVAILPDTKIGSGSIVGYRSLVKGRFPNNVVLAGSPAKVIKKNVAWSHENYSICDDDFFSIMPNYRKLRAVEADKMTPTNIVL